MPPGFKGGSISVSLWCTIHIRAMCKVKFPADMLAMEILKLASGKFSVALFIFVSITILAPGLAEVLYTPCWRSEGWDKLVDDGEWEFCI